MALHWLQFDINDEAEEASTIMGYEKGTVQIGWNRNTLGMNLLWDNTYGRVGRQKSYGLSITENLNTKGSTASEMSFGAPTKSCTHLLHQAARMTSSRPSLLSGSIEN